MSVSARLLPRRGGCGPNGEGLEKHVQAQEPCLGLGSHRGLTWLSGFLNRVGGGRRAQGAINMMEGDTPWSGEHTIQYTDSILQNRTPETYIISLTDVTPINSIKKKEKDS